MFYEPIIDYFYEVPAAPLRANRTFLMNLTKNPHKFRDPPTPDVPLACRSFAAINFLLDPAVPQILSASLRGPPYRPPPHGRRLPDLELLKLFPSEMETVLPIM